MNSELVRYHKRSPDPIVEGCMNTGKQDTDGVVFLHIEPLEGSFCFVGRQSILEAVAVMHGLTPAEVKKRLAYEQPVKKAVNGG